MNALTGTGVLLRNFLRRDKWIILAWVVGITLLYYVQAPSVDNLYATQVEFDKAAAGMEKNAAFIAMAGPARALNTVGGQVAWQASAFGAVLAGLMSMFLIGRHTRVEEETGRDELVRSAAIGRQAPQTAALVVALVANAVVALAVTASLLSYGLATAGSVALGVALFLTGAVFTGIALVAAQLTDGARAMYGIAGAVIGVAYALRAVGDVGNGVLSWFSPIGWGQAMHAFSGERWWPALLLVAGAVVATIAGYVVFARRDIGSGVYAARPGPARAGSDLHSALGLAWKLQRGSLIGWGIGIFLFAMSYGSIGNSIGDLIGDSDAAREMFSTSGAGLIDGFYAAAVLMLALFVTAFAVSSALRPRGEEDAGRVEVLLATAIPRNRWLLGHMLITTLGVVLLVLLAGFGLGLGYALAVGDGARITELTLAALPYAAPVLVIAGIARLLFGVAPRWAGLAWLALGYCVVVMFFGELLKFPDWSLNLSPFTHLALVPAEGFELLPFVALLALAAALSAIGQIAFRRRDVH
ncbi:MAG: polyketide antibiotic transporter [Nocardioides sp.]|nr:polyketide antibiotic transporter [Nocardioides sp.]